jgi:hypothetical protein
LRQRVNRADGPTLIAASTATAARADRWFTIIEHSRRPNMWSSPALKRGRTRRSSCLLTISEESRFCERHADAVTDDEVIEHANVDERERILEPARDELVGVARLRDSAWMLGFISRCHHHLFGWAKAVHFRTLRVAPASIRGE